MNVLSRLTGAIEVQLPPITLAITIHWKNASLLLTSMNNLETNKIS